MEFRATRWRQDFLSSDALGTRPRADAVPDLALCVLQTFRQAVRFPHLPILSSVDVFLCVVKSISGAEFLSSTTPANGFWLQGFD